MIPIVLNILKEKYINTKGRARLCIRIDGN